MKIKSSSVSIANKLIAIKINKTPSSISWVKRHNYNEFLILRLGTLAQDLKVTEKDIVYIANMKRAGRIDV